MPFHEVYRVSFAQGNLTPQVNTVGWPDMQLSPPPTVVVPPGVTSDPSGLTLRIHPQIALGGWQRSVYLDFSQLALPLDTRLLMRLDFDRPNAAGITAPSAEPAEPWAVGLTVSPTSDLFSKKQVNVTCQFNRAPHFGIRLNTPGGLQSDQAAVLIQSLEYGAFQGGDLFDPWQFSLWHAFSGWDAVTNGHTAGNGVLAVTRPPDTVPVEDQRAYSNAKLALSPEAVSGRIGALGASLVTQTGRGVMTVRLRSFSVALNRLDPPTSLVPEIVALSGRNAPE